MSDGSRSPAGRLVLVGTPLGNRGDLSPRARSAIEGAQLILCEDTRSLPRLLGAASVAGLPPRVSCFAANEAARVPRLLEALEGGEVVVYLSDAGMPGWSDPGTTLVAAAVEAGFDVDVIPGPCAAVTAMAASGFSAKDSVFVGFVPRSGGKRRRCLERILAGPGASMVYESGTRVPALLADLAELCVGERQPRVVIGRELTKLHQEFIRGTVRELVQKISQPLRGEVSLVIEGAGWDEGDGGDTAGANRSGTSQAQTALASLLGVLADTTLKPRQKAKKLAELSGGDAREIYACLASLGRRASEPEA